MTVAVAVAVEPGGGVWVCVGGTVAVNVGWPNGVSVEVCRVWSVGGVGVLVGTTPTVRTWVMKTPPPPVWLFTTVRATVIVPIVLYVCGGGA